MPEPIALVVTTHALTRFKNRFPEKIPDGVREDEIGQWLGRIATQAMEGPRNYGTDGSMNCKFDGMRFVIKVNRIGRPHLLTVLCGHFGTEHKPGRRAKGIHVPRYEREESEWDG